MGCLACGGWDPQPLPVCRACRDLVRPVPPRRIDSGLLVYSAALHDGPARRLVHRLKYEAFPGVAPVLAAAMAPLVPPGTRSLVPVPRVVWRRVRFGIDPAAALALELSRRTGVPLVPALAAAVVGPAHAGRSRKRRRRPIFVVRRRPVPPALLVDDVVTTGTTLAAAALRLGEACEAAITATAAPVR